ncbi:MAG: tryptophan synthase subunit alpha [Bacteroidota bacterium]
MNNRIIDLFARKREHILNIYCTAGYPGLHDISDIIVELDKAGVDLVEIGMPYSDPIADGPTIQMSNGIALANGISLEGLFEQLSDIRAKTQVPLILMGYINPVLQYGLEKFCRDAQAVGIDGVILPDLPLREYEMMYASLFEECNLSHVFLITPQTSEERIRKIDELTKGFIYMVSSDSTTGKTHQLSENQITYFKRIVDMSLKNPRLIGFGISDHQSFSQACTYSQGAIIGSAFIKAIEGKSGEELKTSISRFVASILNAHSIPANS